MAFAVSVLVVAGLIAIAWAVVVLFRRLLWPGGEDAVFEALPPRPYGELPGLGQVGGLGQISPDADLSQTGTDSGDMYGE